MNHIVCFHLFNDYSGSPKVLKRVLEGLLEKGYPVDLVTSGGGVLDELIGKPGFRKHGYRYRFSTNPIVPIYGSTGVCFLGGLAMALREGCGVLHQYVAACGTRISRTADG